MIPLTSPTLARAGRAPLMAMATLIAGLHAPIAHAHITLPPGGAPAGSVYHATFRVGHACEGAQATTAIEVRLPTGFTFIEADARPGWTLTRRGDTVTWEAEDPSKALAQHERTTFNLSGRLPTEPGTLWFKVRQRCDVGSVDWDELPDAADPTRKPARPAARLEVMAPS